MNSDTSDDRVGMLDQNAIRHLRGSFEKLRPKIDLFTRVFYARLFEQNPRIALMFRGNIPDQQAKLGELITTVIDELDDIDRIVPVLESLGQRHMNEYRVQRADFDAFVTSLQLTVGEILPGELTSETYLAWFRLFRFIADTMMGAEPDEVRPT